MEPILQDGKEPHVALIKVTIGVSTLYGLDTSATYSIVYVHYQRLTGNIGNCATILLRQNNAVITLTLPRELFA